MTADTTAQRPRRRSICASSRTRSAPRFPLPHRDVPRRDVHERKGTQWQRSLWNWPAIGSGRLTGRSAAGWRADATHGDELGHSQCGNNAYCQDNELSWLDWEHVDDQLLAFCADIVAFRRRHPAFRRCRFFEERPIFGTELSDIGWFRPDGQEMMPDD